MGLSEQDVLAVLKTVKFPGFTRDVVSFGLVRDVTVVEGQVAFRLELAAGTTAAQAKQIEAEARSRLASLPGVKAVEIAITSPGAGTGARRSGDRSVAQATETGPSGLIPGVKRTVAVASGKGGVGKSTVAVNLAVALAATGARVGLLDADVYGPSIPLMMGVRETPRMDPQERLLVPVERFGVRFMSLGFFVEPDLALIWRGPLVMKAVEQLLRDVAWGDLDVLVVDLPPGTGDAQLTLSQKVRLAGAVIVTTPQDVALADAIKGVAMFRKVDVPVLGIVENMSYFVCPHCGGRSEIFGHGGGRVQAERLGVRFLGEVPLDTAIRDGGDTGRPIVAVDPDSPHAGAFRELASRVLDALDHPVDHGADRGTASSPPESDGPVDPPRIY